MIVHNSFWKSHSTIKLIHTYGDLFVVTSNAGDIYIVSSVNAYFTVSVQAEHQSLVIVRFLESFIKWSSYNDSDLLSDVSKSSWMGPGLPNGLGSWFKLTCIDHCRLSPTKCEFVPGFEQYKKWVVFNLHGMW